MNNINLPIMKFSNSLFQQLMHPSLVKSNRATKLFANLNSSSNKIGLSAITQTNLALNQQTATIDVNYSGLPPQAVAAVQYAADIWATLIASPVPIPLQVNWVTLGEPSVLGETVLGETITYFLKSSVKLPANNKTLFTSSYGNKLLGRDPYPNKPDAVISLNSNVPWYFGLDGKTPTDQYDLVTVAMHEMAHSFISSNVVSDDVNTGIGRLRNEGSPGLYDRFVVNGLGQPLIDTTQFPDPSTRLGAQLTGNNLFFNGKNARAANGGTNPRLYAPLEWQQGSSYSHLDEATYGSGNPNSLMTPDLDSAESIHTLGSIGLGIFQDLGWIDQTLVGDQDQNILVGDVGNDTLTGLGNSDRLVGLGGSDKIVGGDGNDILIGGIGNSGDVNAQNLTNSGFDTLIGGRGRDRFALEQGTGYAVISDFHDHEDHLSLVHGLSFRNLSGSRGSNVAIFFHNDLLAVLKGVQASQLTAADFVKL